MIYSYELDTLHVFIPTRHCLYVRYAFDVSPCAEDDGGLSMTEEAIAKIWEQGPPRNNDEAWTYFYF